MTDKKDAQSFRQLELAAAVAPSRYTWPSDVLHWQRMGAAVDEARTRFNKFLEALDEIAVDPRLSPDGKKEERRKTAEKARNALDSSSALRSAIAAATAQLEKWDGKISSSLKPASTEAEARVRAQIRERVFNLKDPRERMQFLQKHAGDIVTASALLEAPAYLSGLSDAELALVKSKVEANALPPEIAAAKADTARGLAELERGWRNVRAKIIAGGALETPLPMKGAA